LARSSSATPRRSASSRTSRSSRPGRPRTPSSRRTGGRRTGWTRSATERLERDVQAKRLEADAPFQLGKLGVPQRAVLALRAVDLDRPGMKGVLAQVDEPRALLALLGGVGAGKTVAAAYLLRKRLADAASAQRPSGGTHRDVGMWVASSELASLSTFTEADRAWFERMQECAILVLDDFGTEDLHSHAVQRLERLIDVRYGNGRETVLTSNCNLDGFVKRVGERIADRFREAGRVVVCGDVSLRRRHERSERAPAADSEPTSGSLSETNWTPPTRQM
jgi:hypothetical protein